MNPQHGLVVLALIAGCDADGAASLNAAPDAEAASDAVFVVTIGNDGALRLYDENLAEVADLVRAAERALSADPNLSARVHIGPAVSLRRLSEVVEALRSAGMDVSLSLALH